MRHVLIVISAAALAGCGGEGGLVDFAPVSGRIEIDGEPAPGIVVRFQPDFEPVDGQSPVASSGLTDEDGRYRLATARGTQRAGAAVGFHFVTFEGLERFDGRGADELARIADAGVAVPEVRLGRSPRDVVRFEVTTAGTEAADFDLSGRVTRD
ncbi:MAG: hypothetical protein AAF532_13700 [Planctomycetota bacterium]